jgi:wobble nucleotide-excising tRNase
MCTSAKEKEDTLKKELAETNDQVKVLKERTAEVQKGEQTLLPKVFVHCCTESVREFSLVYAGLEKQLTDLKVAA